ncbi:hypothetical protein Q7C18_04855 [Nesterenkonia sp. CL21]|uniref:hypothetical protein n=1 Tax=Nesterenkonia sp. CL21 TaxID=3064894 RepID=UPI002878ACA0|nr:hypothetical protein [Nesterenkonia sp. CL21]MDS2172017.1 hypothetical protein [Nesterenkonia sp. CL21]
MTSIIDVHSIPAARRLAYELGARLVLWASRCEEISVVRRERPGPQEIHRRRLVGWEARRRHDDMVARATAAPYGYLP